MTSKAGGLALGVAFCLLAACAGPQAEVEKQEAAQTAYDIGLGALAEGNMPKAISELRKAVENAPQNARYHHALGNAYLRAEETDKAVTEFLRAVELDPRFADAYNDLGAGESHALVGNEQAAVSFTSITPLDVLDALNSNNQMEIFGTYTWAMEQDEVGIQAAANSVANLFKDALNATVANATLPNGDTDALVDLVLDLLFANLGGAITILLSNIPLLGLGDDLLGGAFYVGIGATGTLASLIDVALAGVSVPALPLLGDNLIPPKIVGGGLYTLGGARNFSQAFNGAGGQHTYNFAAGPG